jgi:hypothetical protein
MVCADSSCFSVSDADEGLILSKSTSLPEAVELSGVLIETALSSKDEGAIKRTLYRRSAELYWSSPHLAFPPQQPLSLHVRVDIADPGPRKSIKDMLKPCIDGLEPIMSRPDGLQPFTLEQLDAGEWRTLAPQDEMVVELRMDVRGGPKTASAQSSARLPLASKLHACPDTDDSDGPDRISLSHSSALSNIINVLQKTSIHPNALFDNRTGFILSIDDCISNENGLTAHLGIPT